MFDVDVVMEVVEVDHSIVYFVLNNDTILEFKLYVTYFHVDLSRQNTDGGMVIIAIFDPSRIPETACHKSTD